MENTNKENQQAWVVVAIAVSTLAILGGMYYLFTQVSAQNQLVVNNVVQRIENLEAEKVGWEDNYKKLKQIYANSKYKDQQTQSLDWALNQMWVKPTANDTSANTNTWSTNSTTPTTSSLSPDYKEWKLTKEKIDAILANGYVEGAATSKVLWVEYSDVECPYCKRFHQAGTLSAVMNKYEWKLSYVLQHFPLSFHPHAQKGAETLECVGELGWKEKFFEFETKVFALPMEEQPSYDKLEKIASDMKIDTKKLKSCVDSGKYTQKITTDMNNWQSLFGVQWTPWNVIINVETGKWVLVPWAYPASEIEKVVEYVMK